MRSMEIPQGVAPIKSRTIESSDLMRKMQEGAKNTLQTIEENSLKGPATPIKDVMASFFDTAPEKKAELLPSTKLLFQAFGIDAEHIDPVPLGEGLNHIVFSFDAPDGKKRVVKIPRESAKGLMVGGHADERENIELVQKYFPQYAVPTEVLTDKATGAYVIMQDVVVGTPITNKSQTRDIDRQLQDIMKCNRKLMKETGHSMDFVGVQGFLSWVRHQYKQIFTRKSVFEVSNLLLDKEGKIRIIDYDMLRFNNVSTEQKLISNLGFATNYYLMKSYFGVSVRGK